VWPSIYEPFGGVSEYTLVGTPCVARQTGGLVQQVFDIAADPEKGNGIAYATPSFSGDDWRAFLDADPFVRANTWCGRNQIDALRTALARAAEAFAAPAVYRKMLENLRKPDDQFSWDRAVNEYRQVFQRAVQ
jgi:glycogen synthase